jgi:DNA-binding transcriptional LysR family regulator
MTLDPLRYFIETAKFEHVGKASASLRISASAVSTAIQALEEKMGGALFIREKKRIRLNENGRKLQERARAILESVHQLPGEISGAKREIVGSYRIGASHFLASRVLAPAWFKIQAAHPKLVGEVCSMSTALVVNEIVKGSLDFGLCFSPLRHPDTEEIELYRGTLLLVAGSHHPLLKRKKPFAPLSLSAYPAVIHKSAVGVDICETHPAFERFGIQPQIKVMFDDDATAIECLRESDAWSLLPDLAVEKTKGIQALPLPKGWSAPYHVSLVMRRNSASGLLKQSLAEQLARGFEESRFW